MNNKLFYKQRPYIYAFIGIVAFAFASDSKLAFFSGLVLLSCSYFVFEMRKKYQENLLKNKNKNISSDRKVDKKDYIVIDDG